MNTGNDDNTSGRQPAPVGGGATDDSARSRPLTSTVAAAMSAAGQSDKATCDTATPSTGSSGTSPGSSPRFPHRLRQALDAEETNAIMWWNPDGLSFSLHKSKFSNSLLRTHFQGNNFASFRRKLNRWGFLRIMDHKQHQSQPPQGKMTPSSSSSSSEVMVYYNDLFRREAPELIRHMHSRHGRGNASVPAPSSYTGSTLRPPVLSARLIRDTTPSLLIRSPHSQRPVLQQQEGEPETSFITLSTPLHDEASTSPPPTFSHQQLQLQQHQQQPQQQQQQQQQLGAIETSQFRSEAPFLFPPSWLGGYNPTPNAALSSSSPPPLPPPPPPPPVSSSAAAVFSPWNEPSSTAIQLPPPSSPSSSMSLQHAAHIAATAHTLPSATSVSSPPVTTDNNMTDLYLSLHSVRTLMNSRARDQQVEEEEQQQHNDSDLNS